MRGLFFTGISAGLLLLMAGSGCDKYDSSNSITGIWRNRENYSNDQYRTYNISVEQYDYIDTSTYVIYNMYNLGMDFETLVQLKDSTFRILGSSSAISISGKGTFHRSSFTIEWEYSISGDTYDPSVYAFSEKP
ncbi:MAG: hypothetical protein AB7S54_11430 [Bacteroidales bacterium]